LAIQASPDVSAQYISFMNAIFSAQVALISSQASIFKIIEDRSHLRKELQFASRTVPSKSQENLATNVCGIVKAETFARKEV